jgi:hypothetical protein
VHSSERSPTRDRRLNTGMLLVACLVFGFWVTFDVTHNSPVDFSVYYMAGALARGGHSFYAISDGAWTQTAHQLGITHFTRP